MKKQKNSLSNTNAIVKPVHNYIPPVEEKIKPAKLEAIPNYNNLFITPIKSRFAILEKQIQFGSPISYTPRSSKAE